LDKAPLIDLDADSSTILFRASRAIEVKVSMKHFASCVLVVASAACGGKTPAPETGAAPAQQDAAGRNRDVITAAELSKPELGAQSLLSVIRTLRPTFLVNRGLQSYTCPKTTNDCSADPDAGAVHASVDNGRIVRIEELDAIHVVTVQEVLYLNVATAMNRFGGAARSGPVILVVMKKGKE
jgi:hypothetical protein